MGDSILKSPILAKYVAEGYEVLLLDDPIDEFTTQHLFEYEKRKVKSISKDDVQILDSDEIAKKKLQKLKEMYKPLTDWYKTHLGRQVEKSASPTSCSTHRSSFSPPNTATLRRWRRSTRHRPSPIKRKRPVTCLPRRPSS